MNKPEYLYLGDFIRASISVNHVDNPVRVNGVKLTQQEAGAMINDYKNAPQALIDKVLHDLALRVDEVVERFDKEHVIAARYIYLRPLEYIEEGDSLRLKQVFYLL